MMLIKKNRIILLFILLFSLSTFYFYSHVAFDVRDLKVTYWVFLLVCTLLSYRVILGQDNKNTLYIKPIKFYLFTVLFSIVPAYITWGQSIQLSMRVILPYLAYVLVLFLWRYKPKIENIEKIIYVLCGLYLICYFYALWMAPKIVFGNPDTNLNDMRGFMRLYVSGRGFLYLGYFVALVHYTEKKDKRWLFITLFLFAVIIMHVVRQYILFSFLIGFLYIFKKIKWWKKIAIIILFVAGMFYAINNIPVVKNLVELTEGQVLSNKQEENIRISEYKYFFTDFSPNFYNYIIGNGMSHIESNYGAFYNNVVNDEWFFFMSDVGYAQIFAVLGLIGLIPFIYIFYRITRQKVPDSLMYAKLYMYFAFCANILSGYLLSNLFIVSICFVLYILEYANSQNKEIKPNKDI